MTTSERTYSHTRPRGLAPWRPQARTLPLLEAIGDVLAEYRDHLPLTGRQIFYRLVGTRGYPKTETGYARLLDTLSRARRAGLVPFDAIRDDGVTAREPNGFTGMPDFWSAVAHTAGRYQRDRLEGQPYAIEVWVEAGGMVPQAVRVAEPFGIPVYSSGGFDSLTAKYDAAQRVVGRDRDTVILHIGDHDPSGCSLFDSAADDVARLADDLDPGAYEVTFVRVAVTPEQAERHNLPTSPPKSTDRRGDWTGGTVQAEALPPDVLAAELRQAVQSLIDPSVYADLLATEDAEREHLRAAVHQLEQEQGP